MLLNSKSCSVMQIEVRASDYHLLNSQNPVYLDPVDIRTASIPAVHHEVVGGVRVLHKRRSLEATNTMESNDLDWALCSFDRSQSQLSNTLALPDGTILVAKGVAQEDPIDAAVWVNTGPTGIEKGFIIGDYSLVAVPGSKKFQRMWVVILDRPVRK